MIWRTWPRRIGVEVRNVALVMVLSAIALAAFVGVVIGLTALSVH